MYFADAVHPEYQRRPAHGWVRKGEHLAVRRGKGRQRVSLAGALCPETDHCQIVEDVRGVWGRFDGKMLRTVSVSARKSTPVGNT